MKGIVFTQFLEFVEAEFGVVVTDRVVSSCDLASGGSYTAVGTYPHTEILDMTAALAGASQLIDAGADPVELLHDLFADVHRCAIADLCPEGQRRLKQAA